MFNLKFYFDQQENAGGFLLKLKFNLKDKLNYLKCHRILTFVLNPKLILIIRVVRSCGNAYDLVSNLTTLEQMLMQSPVMSGKVICLCLCGMYGCRLQVWYNKRVWGLHVSVDR